MTDAASAPGREARHLALNQVGANGQARIEKSAVLIVGVGGIGCAASQYLAASGVGRIVLCDFDTIDVTNLGRQILYGPVDIGNSKVGVARQRLSACNPDINIDSIAERLDDQALAERIKKVDIVLDGTDNFATRFQVNDACVAAQKTLVSGAAIRLEGQLAVFGPNYAVSPCYRCLYTEADESLESCAGNGVLGPVPGVIGSMMAIETLKICAGLEVERGVLRLYDAASSDFQRVAITKRPDCPACH
ncbi:MAG: HesA/MoeB/ThiF family protein [Gammaproteobacteria bacterium]|nr:HesA/MoeB/ThiF family protein [Gammaproteobacteria bacterium]